MKYTLSLIVALAFAAFTTSALAADTTTIWLTKTSSEGSVKVCTAKSCYGNVPIKYADGATWANAKDSYEVSPATADALSKGGCITVHADGGISVSSKVCKTSKSDKMAKKEASKDEQKK